MTNYAICDSKDVSRLSSRGAGVKFPWYNRSIRVGQGFFVEKTQKDLDLNKGRPSPPSNLKEMDIEYITYKCERNGRVGYFCERIK